MTQVEIEYCVPCGLLDTAQMVQRHLLSEFGEALDRVALVTGEGGVFRVHVDGETVFDGQEESYDRGTFLDHVRDPLDGEEVPA